MSSAPLPPTTSNGAPAHKSGPERGTWRGNGDSSPAFRGQAKSRPGNGRGGGRGGRGGGRQPNAKGGPTSRNENPASKLSTDQPQAQPKLKPPPVATNGSKLAPPPSAQPTASPTQSTASNKSSNNRSKPPSRKPSEQKGPRGVPNGDSASKPATNPQQPPNASPANGRGNGRRKRSQSSQSQIQTPLAPVISVTRPAPPSRKASVVVEPVQNRPRSVVIAAKDLPPHLAPPGTPSFDIKHDIDALVERVRAVAMENRPHTPGSHIDWAGDDDDSLPDLDDWGVTSNTNTDPDPGKLTTNSDDPGRIISPILENALRPLPTIVDVETTQAKTAPNGDANVTQEKRALEKAAEPALSHGKVEGGSASAVTSPTLASESQLENFSPSKTPLHPSLPPKPAPALDLSARPSTSFAAEPMSAKDETPRTGSILGTLADSIHAPSRSSQNPSPERGLSTSTSSAPSHINTHKVPNVGRGPFQPAHGRSHTVGRPYRQPNMAGSPNFPDHGVDADRPRRGDVTHHARTHSSPPTGAGATRAPHATRPVLTRDALSVISRSLGAASRREHPPIAVTTIPAKD